MLLVTAALFNCFSGCLSVKAEEVNAVVEICGVLAEPSVDANNPYGSISLFSNTVYSGCYGNQLTGEAKGLYDAFVETYVTQRGSSKLTYNLKTELTFKDKYIDGDLQGSAEYAEVTEEITIMCQVAMDAFIYDCPQVFWLSTMKYQYSISLSIDYFNNAYCTISQIEFIPVETYSGASAKISSYDSGVDSVINNIKNAVDSSVSRRETLKYIHDYLCKKGYYSYSGLKITHTSEPLFIGGGGVVCEGYADAFKVICDRLGIPCACIVGGADSNGKEEPHMWNYVQLEDGKWYLIDITWDDQISGIRYTYFLANYNTQGFYEKIYDERREQGDFSATGYMNFVYPVLSRTEYPEVTHLVRVRNSILEDIVYSEICLDYNADDKTDARDIVWLKKVLAGII